VHEAVSQGRQSDLFAPLWLDVEQTERGLADGTVAVDERLRDALRTLAGEPVVPAHGATFALPSNGGSILRFPRPGVVDDAAYAVECAVLGEADIVRAQRRLDELEARMASLERRPTARLARAVRRGWGRRGS
jgi:hypothetical protein